MWMKQIEGKSEGGEVLEVGKFDFGATTRLFQAVVSLQLDSFVDDFSSNIFISISHILLLRWKFSHISISTLSEFWVFSTQVRLSSVGNTSWGRYLQSKAMRGNHSAEENSKKERFALKLISSAILGWKFSALLVSSYERCLPWNELRWEIQTYAERARERWRLRQENIQHQEWHEHEIMLGERMWKAWTHSVNHDGIAAATRTSKSVNRKLKSRFSSVSSSSTFCSSSRVWCMLWNWATFRLTRERDCTNRVRIEI